MVKLERISLKSREEDSLNQERESGSFSSFNCLIFEELSPHLSEFRKGIRS